MSDEPKKRKRAWIGWTITALLLLAYPQSIGPAWWVANRHPNALSHDVYHTIYWPIERACRRFDPIFNVFKWYTDLWIAP
jgi:hypothetical protein